MKQMENPDKKVYLVSLGCSKNLVDSEGMSYILTEDGYELTDEPGKADVIVVNTCGFIESAKTEAIDTILDMADYKKNGRCDFLIATGCLAQRYPKEISENLPEVDAILGISRYSAISDTISRLYERNNNIPDCPFSALTDVERDGSMDHLRPERKPSTSGYAYLKIAEGCSNNCSYCAIPGIRGPFVSRPMEDLLREAGELVKTGHTELVIIAQDTTRYGLDIYGKRSLTELISGISAIEGVRKIRLLYCYCDGITDELIEKMRTDPKIARYMDMPIQHISADVLKRMNRKDTPDTIRNTIGALRKAMPDITLRTTIITGFPGETKEDHDLLVNFIRETGFDLLGCFIYSPEENTPAYHMKPRVPKKETERRYAEIMETQKDISFKKNKEKLGKKIKVTIESTAPDGVFYLGRGDGQAPEIDPPVYIAASDQELEIGKEYTIRIVDHSDYDLTGVTCDESSE